MHRCPFYMYICIRVPTCKYVDFCRCNANRLIFAHVHICVLTYSDLMAVRGVRSSFLELDLPKQGGKWFYAGYFHVTSIDDPVCQPEHRAPDLSHKVLKSVSHIALYILLSVYILIIGF